MDKGIKFKGISPKLIRDKSGNTEEIFIVKFEIITEDFSDALEVKKLFETKVSKLINEQMELDEFTNKKDAKKL